MSTTLLIASIVISAIFSVYALLYIFLSLSALFNYRRHKTVETRNGKDEEEIAVLIPARNEGKGVLDLISSLYNQDYRGRISVYFLLKDENDSSWPCLQEELNHNKNNWQRKINVIFCAQDAKSIKLNFALESIKTSYIAILDADHRPSANWLSSSLTILKKEKAALVQSRRAPLDLSTLPQIWDSGQNHGGNEILNLNLAAFGQNVFFTGTAALFRQDILQKFPFHKSLTEDTFLSHDILLSGEKIAYNDEAISYEEVSPSLRAYIFRRRRWSAGHSHSFFSHLGKIIISKLSLFTKLILLLHGKFYLIPLLVVILLNLYGLHFFSQLSLNYQIVVLLISLFFALLLSSFSKQGKVLSFFDFIVAAFYLWPQVAILSVLALRFSGSESYFYILSFPLAKDLAYFNLALLLAPLTPLFASVLVFESFRRKRNFWLFVTYPVSLFFDIYAGALGFFDFIFSKNKWSVIKRNNRYSAVLLPKDVQTALSLEKLAKPNYNKIYLFLLLSAFILFLVNDLLAVNNCGELKKFLWNPLLLKPSSDMQFDINVIKKNSKEGYLNVSVPLNISGAPDNFNLDIYLDGEIKETKKIKNGLQTLFAADYPYGFDSHEISFKFYSTGINEQTSCYRKFYFSNTLKEVKGKYFFLNGEKFLIKGIIPSFLGAKNALSIADGFKQIKEIGANALRFYHGAGSEVMEAAADNGLLVIDQPDRSTWGDFNPGNLYQSEKFIERYGKLLEEHEGNPFSLLVGFGNEWELGQKAQSTAISGSIYKLINQANKKFSNPLSTYSTYYTFVDYPVNIAAVNMLDTGAIYWRDVMSMLKRGPKPFYASEFGGFVAFLEDTDPEIRYNRLLSEWEDLLSAEAVGANVFQSHDNWAQPLVEGYNNPNKDEQPDDKRGFWTNKNKEKLELTALKEIFSDFSVVINRDKIRDCSADISLQIKNKREYNLKNLSLQYRDEEIFLGDFLPEESRDFDIDLGELQTEDFSLELLFLYSTHSGLASASTVKLITPCYGAPALILNPDFQMESRSEKNIYGRLIATGTLDIFLPVDWQEFTINGKDYKRAGDFASLNIGGPYYDALDMAISRDNGNWQNFTEDMKIKDGGLFYVRFKWPETEGNKSSLILSGLGAAKVTFYIDAKPKEINVHSYRENIISASFLDNPQAGDTIVFSIDRNQTMYVMEAAEANYQVPFITNGDMFVFLEKARVFSPALINLEKKF